MGTMLNQNIDSNIEKFRDRKLALLLYPDSPEHVLAIEKISESYDYAMILHDKDLDSNGNLKKPHYHVVLRFKNQQWNSAICKDLGVGLNYSQRIKNFDNALTYLLHYNDSDKYQYKLDDVKGTLKTRLKELINSTNKSEGEKIMDLIDYIDKCDYIFFKDFANYCASNGYWSEFRRSASIFIKIIEEHNKNFC